MTYSETIANDQLSEAMGLLYNKWFAKWRSVKIVGDQAWSDCIYELGEVVKRYRAETVKKIGWALLDELDARNGCKHGTSSMAAERRHV